MEDVAIVTVIAEEKLVVLLRVAASDIDAVTRTLSFNRLAFTVSWERNAEAPF